MRHSEGFLRLVENARTRVKEVTTTQTVERQRRGAYLIDVREESEWQRGRIAGAQHLGKGIIERDIEKTIPSHDTEIILYCGGGYRSVLAAEALQRMGYTNVASMTGGWRAWFEEGLPTEVPGRS